MVKRHRCKKVTPKGLICGLPLNHTDACISAERYARQKQQVLIYRINNPKQLIWTRAKRNAKMRNIEFNIEVADIPDIPVTCPVFPWIVIEYTVGQTGRGARASDTVPSLDRTDNTRGYVVGNLRIISYRANRFKSEMSPEETFYLAADAERYFGTFFAQAIEDVVDDIPLDVLLQNYLENNS